MRVTITHAIPATTARTALALNPVNCLCVTAATTIPTIPRTQPPTHIHWMLRTSCRSTVAHRLPNTTRDITNVTTTKRRVLKKIRSDRDKASGRYSGELSAEAIDARYHKIQAQPDEIEQLLIKRGVKAIPRKSAEIVLDPDATDDPLHGSQQGAYFHGYYRHYCYLPLYCFCGNIPLFAKLRDCKR